MVTQDNESLWLDSYEQHKGFMGCICKYKVSKGLFVNLKLSKGLYVKILKNKN